MAHSSGGGSSSSGSHYGGSSGSGGSNPKFGKTYYPGSNRYVYYTDGHPRYYFSDEPYTEKIAKKQKSGRIISGALSFFISLILLILFVPAFFHSFKKVEMDYDTQVIIEDRAEVLTDEDLETLTASYDSFLELTGVSPAFVSVEASEWEGSYDNLETYALRTYYNMFSDEKHWLIMFSDNGSRDSWAFEGIIGDDCESAVTTETENKLTDNLQKNLWSDSRYTVGQAVAESFYSISEGITETTFDTESVPLILILLFVFVSGIILSVKGLKMDPANDPKVRSSECQTDKQRPLEDTCEYCGGVYVHGLHLNCPHCGAPIKASI